MKSFQSTNRRDFIRSGLIGSVGLAAALSPGASVAATTKPKGDACHGLKLGITTYSLRKFSLDQAIAMTKEAGVQYISLKDMHLPMKSSPEQREETRKKVEAAGLILTGGGV